MEQQSAIRRQLLLLPCLNAGEVLVTRDDDENGIRHMAAAGTSSASISSHHSNKVVSIYGFETISEEPESLNASGSSTTSSSSSSSYFSRRKAARKRKIGLRAPFSAMTQSYVRLMNGLGAIGNLADLAPAAA